MNSDNLSQLIQRGFRVTLGATSFLIETLQDPQKRDENLEKLKSDFSVLTEEWAEKGELTEQEARNFVETILAQRNGASTPADSSANPEPTATATQTTAQQEIQELTAQMAALRAELENLRAQDSSD